MTARRKHSLADVLGPLEAEIMDVVWETGEVTVRDVHQSLEANPSARLHDRDDDARPSCR